MKVKEKLDKSKNQINTIYPYRTEHGDWAYDDEDVPVYKEAFVCGSSELIDQLVGKDCVGFTAHISAKRIPGYTVKLNNIDEKVKKDDAIEMFGDEVEVEDPTAYMPQGWYEMEGTGHRNWFCGHLLDYFEGYPKEIYVKIEKPKKNGK